jgi:ABC-2 type transport system ATP-binding protein
MTSAITATGLRKSFDGEIVLDGIDLEVGAGTTFSLLGPDGGTIGVTGQFFAVDTGSDGASR